MPARNRKTLSLLLVGALLLLSTAALCVALARPVNWTIKVAGGQYGISEESCLNAFGHRPDPRLEIRLGDVRIPLWRVQRPCDCSLCKALATFEESKRGRAPSTDSSQRTSGSMATD
jgi:hypothetical protein